MFSFLPPPVALTHSVLGMDFADIVQRRRSTRAFRDDPVPNADIARLLAIASRSPSGGNVQPWRVFVLNGPSMSRFRDFMHARDIETPGYAIYPQPLREPYRTARFELGEQLYATIGIPRDDKAGRLTQMAKNYDFFGAPAALFLFVDRQMGKPQWSDLGMFLQTFMLAAVASGIDTCAQEAWTMYSESVAEFVGAREDLMLFCGLAIGFGDQAHPINSLRSERFAVEKFATFLE